MSFKILFFGDVIGALGRETVARELPALRAEYAPDLVIANVENLSHGRGISEKGLLALDAAGIDAYTSGNHVWENTKGTGCFDDPRWAHRLVRPANIIAGRPGRGTMVIEKNGVRVLVTNLLGSLFMKHDVQNPFTAIDAILAEHADVQIRLVDFHTETTSEKEAFGHTVDGRVTAVLGTHTHVATADHKILQGGTAYVTDVGRNGGHDTVVGFEKNASIQRFLDPQNTNYVLPEHGPVEINAILLTVDPLTGKALAIDRIRKIVDG